MNDFAQAIVIGTSAGAIDALSVILPALPREYPLPVIVVVHLPVEKDSVIVELFSSKCLVRVCEVEDKTPIAAGMVYFAPPDYHVLIEPDRKLSLSSEEPVQYSRPSIDVLFESAADVYSEKLIGIVLTGANSDGAAGLKRIVEAGGTGLVQQPEDAFAPPMPRAALEACPGARAMSLDQIATYMCEIGNVDGP